jgi:membrane-bound lytic murein transglycosylase MltF
MKLEQAKKIMENSGLEILEAYRTISSNQFDIVYKNYVKQLVEKESQCSELRRMLNDFLFNVEAKNMEQLQNMVKNFYDHGDTQDYIDPYN